MASQVSMKRKADGPATEISGNMPFEKKTRTEEPGMLDDDYDSLFDDGVDEAVDDNLTDSAHKAVGSMSPVKETFQVSRNDPMEQDAALPDDGKNLLFRDDGADEPANNVNNSLSEDTKANEPMDVELAAFAGEILDAVSSVMSTSKVPMVDASVLKAEVPEVFTLDPEAELVGGDDDDFNFDDWLNEDDDAEKPVDDSNGFPQMENDLDVAAREIEKDLTYRPSNTNVVRSHDGVNLKRLSMVDDSLAHQDEGKENVAPVMQNSQASLPQVFVQGQVVHGYGALATPGFLSQQVNPAWFQPGTSQVFLNGPVHPEYFGAAIPQVFQGAGSSCMSYAPAYSQVSQLAQPSPLYTVPAYGQVSQLTGSTPVSSTLAQRQVSHVASPVPRTSKKPARKVFPAEGSKSKYPKKAVPKVSKAAGRVSKSFKMQNPRVPAVEGFTSECDAKGNEVLVICDDDPVEPTRPYPKVSKAVGRGPKNSKVPVAKVSKTADRVSKSSKLPVLQVPSIDSLTSVRDGNGIEVFEISDDDSDETDERIPQDFEFVTYKTIGTRSGAQRFFDERLRKEVEKHERQEELEKQQPPPREVLGLIENGRSSATKEKQKPAKIPPAKRQPFKQLDHFCPEAMAERKRQKEHEQKRRQEPQQKPQLEDEDKTVPHLIEELDAAEPQCQWTDWKSAIRRMQPHGKNASIKIRITSSSTISTDSRSPYAVQEYMEEVRGLIIACQGRVHVTVDIKGLVEAMKENTNYVETHKAEDAEIGKAFERCQRCMEHGGGDFQWTEYRRADLHLHREEFRDLRYVKCFWDDDDIARGKKEWYGDFAKKQALYHALKDIEELVEVIQRYHPVKNINERKKMAKDWKRSLGRAYRVTREQREALRMNALLARQSRGGH